MKVSIIIATYGEDYWEELARTRAYPSACAQRYRYDDEHDASPQVCMGHYPHRTIAEARNISAVDAEGDWLCFLDADDELAPGFLDAMTEAEPLVRPIFGNMQLLLTPAVQQIRKGRPGRPFFFPECSFETGNWLIIGTLVQRDLFMEVGGFEDFPHGLEDWQLWAKCVKAGARIVKVPKAVYVAHWNAKSKHHVFARNRPAYMKAYEAARASVWA